MNKVILIGNLTRDPQTRTVSTANGEVTVCSFGIAVNRRNGRQNNGQEQTDFFNITAWRQLGDNCARFLSKGRKVYVSGPVSVRTYQAQDGTTRASLEVTADEVEFLSSRGDDQGNGGFSAPAAPAMSAPTAQNNGFQSVENDELPF